MEDPPITSMSIEYTNQNLENNESENETLEPVLQFSPTCYEEPENDHIEEINNNPQDSDVQSVKNEVSLITKSEGNVLNEKNHNILLRNVYRNIFGSLVFLIYKVMIPFGEYVLTNSTLWIILKSTVEVFLEILLYIILAICYVFLRIITQMETNSKEVPQKTKKALK